MPRKIDRRGGAVLNRFDDFSHPMSESTPVKKGSAFLRQSLRRCRQAVFAMMVFTFGINLLMLTASLYSLQLFDRVLTSRSVSTLIYLSVLALVAFAILAFTEFVRGQIASAIGTWFEERVGPRVFAAAVAGQTPMAPGPGATQPLRDVSQLRNFFVGPHLFPIFDAPWAPVMMVVLFLLHPLLGIIAIIGAVLLGLLAFATDAATKIAQERANALTGEGLYDMDVAIRNADSIRAMGMMPALAQRWGTRTLLAMSYVRHANTRSNLLGSISRALRQVLQVAILAAGAWLALKGEVSAGALVASTILVARALAPVEMAVGGWRHAVAARASYKRLGQFLEVSEVRGADARAMKPKGRITVEDVLMMHPGQREPTLRGVSFALEPGESLAIRGPSGSGKTTLARLLVGAVRPSAGSVRFDGIDLSTWDAADRGNQIGYVPQSVELFRGTIEENIARLRTTVPALVLKAAELARAHEFIQSLPRAYQTPIGEGGSGLSGGQAQRIGLARALFGGPKFVVLDEPNAHLDRPGEHQLIATLKDLKAEGVTVIVITHRSNLLEHVDKILLMHEGRVAMFGPRQDVLARLEASRRQRVQLVQQGNTSG
jgi:PrtD family type I secretion system ABC transporter